MLSTKLKSAKLHGSTGYITANYITEYGMITSFFDISLM